MAEQLGKDVVLVGDLGPLEWGDEWGGFRSQQVARRARTANQTEAFSCLHGYLGDQWAQDGEYLTQWRKEWIQVANARDLTWDRGVRSTEFHPFEGGDRRL